MDSGKYKSWEKWIGTNGHPPFSRQDQDEAPRILLFKSRLSVDPIPELPVFTSGIRGSRTSTVSISLEQKSVSSILPTQSIQLIHPQMQLKVEPQEQQHQHPNHVKPVSEANDKNEDVVQVIANLGAVSGYGQQGSLLTLTASSSPTPTANVYLQERPQHQERQQQEQRPIQPIQYKSTPQVTLPESHVIHQVIPVMQYMPQKSARSQKQQQFLERNEYVMDEARSVKQRAHVAPRKSKPQADYYEGRTKKPIAQVIRRYREETVDGSIIWGFENDDGSFKEEIIGVDCITRGKYGYIDPDGLRREYTYETGIKCDEDTQKHQEQDILKTFVDYQENKLVLPSGKTIDLSTMGKKKGRRPQYRN